MKKIIFLILTMLVVTCVLSGCVQSTIGVKLNKNGTGSVSVRLGIREDFYEQLKSNDSDPFENKKTEKYECGGDTYISYSESEEYSSYEEIQKSLLDMTYETELFGEQESDETEADSDTAEIKTTADKENHIFKTVEIEKKSGIFYSVYSFNVVLNPQAEEQNGQNINDLYKLILTVEMPNKITQSKNGKTEENKAEFEISDLTKATEFAAVSEVNHYGVIIGIIAVLVAVAVVFAIIAKKKH